RYECGRTGYRIDLVETTSASTTVCVHRAKEITCGIESNRFHPFDRASARAYSWNHNTNAGSKWSDNRCRPSRFVNNRQVIGTGITVASEVDGCVKDSTWREIQATDGRKTQATVAHQSGGAGTRVDAVKIRQACAPTTIKDAGNCIHRQ